MSSAGAGALEAPDHERAEAVTALEAEFGELITHFRRLLQRNAHQVSPGMLPATYKVFTAVARCGQSSITALSERMVIDKGQLSRAIRELEELALVRRAPDPADGRVSLVSLTDLGEERLRTARLPQESMILQAVDGWGITDLQNLTRLLAGLRAGVRDADTTLS